MKEKTNEIPEKMSIFGIIAVFLVNFGYMSDMVIVPAIGNIYGQFAGTAPMPVLNFILTGSQFMAVFSPLVAIALMRHFSKKHVMIGFFTLFTICSICGCLVLNAYYIALMRAFVGFAGGGLCSVAMALIVEIYRNNPKTCANLTGYFKSAMTLTGALLSFIAGFVCDAFGWTSVFKIYWFAVPILIMLIFCLPWTPPEKISSKELKKTAAEKKESLWNRHVIAQLASFLFINLSFCLFCYSIHVYVLETNLGDSAFAGTVTAVGNCCSVLMGLVFGVLYRKFKRGTPIYFYACLIVCFVMLSIVVNKAWLIAAMIFGAMGYGPSIAYHYMAIKDVVPVTRISTGIALVTAVMGLGAALSSFALTFLEFLGFPGMVSVFPLYAGIAAAGCVISIMLTIRSKKTESA